MKKKNEIFSVDEVLSSILKQSGFEDKSEYLKIYKIWPAVVGEKIAENTCLESAKRGTLFVNVSNPAWMQELHFLKGMIIEKLDNKLGEGTIRDIRFKTGHVPSQGDKKMDFSDVSLDDGELKMMEKESSGISDPEIREAFQHLMETHLKSKKDK